MENVINVPLKFTVAACNEVKRLLAQPDMESDMFLRVGVKGGGCSGLSYILGFDKKEEDDNIYEFEGFQFIMKIAHEMYLNGMEVDYSSGLDARGFIFQNPNASSSCGCGTSFAV